MLKIKYTDSLGNGTEIAYCIWVDERIQEKWTAHFSSEAGIYTFCFSSSTNPIPPRASLISFPHYFLCNRVVVCGNCPPHQPRKLRMLPRSLYWLGQSILVFRSYKSLHSTCSPVTSSARCDIPKEGTDPPSGSNFPAPHSMDAAWLGVERIWSLEVQNVLIHIRKDSTSQLPLTSNFSLSSLTQIPAILEYFLSLKNSRLTHELYKDPPSSCFSFLSSHSRSFNILPPYSS